MKPKVLYLHNAGRIGDALQERVEALAPVATVTTACLDTTPGLQLLQAIANADLVLHERHRNNAEEERLDTLQEHATDNDTGFHEIPGDTNDLATFLALRQDVQRFGAAHAKPDPVMTEPAPKEPDADDDVLDNGNGDEDEDDEPEHVKDDNATLNPAPGTGPAADPDAPEPEKPSDPTPNP